MWIKLSLQNQCWNIESMKYMYTNFIKQILKYMCILGKIEKEIWGNKKID